MAGVRPAVAEGGHGIVLDVDDVGKAQRFKLEYQTTDGAFGISVVALAPPWGASLLDLPIRLPLPSKVTIEVLPPIDLVERFGSSPDHDEVYEEITGEMQDTLSGLQEERTLPVVG